MLKNPIMEDYIIKVIFTFHMPLFMGICGFFFAMSMEKYGVHEYIRYKLYDRILSLIIPMLSFGLIKMVIVQECSVMDFVKSVHDIWFLGDLTINTIVMVIVTRWCNGNFYHDFKFLLFGLLLVNVPKIGYGGQGVFMYIFFVIGYYVYKNRYLFYKIRNFLFIVVVLYLFIFILSDNVSYEINSFLLNPFKHGIIKVLVVDTLKILLGVSGSFFILILINAFFSLIKDSFLGKRALKQGRQTMRIYLLNIIIIEMILGPAYRNMIMGGVSNILHSNGFGVELISTFFVTCLLLEFMVLIIDMLSINNYISKILFYR